MSKSYDDPDLRPLRWAIAFLRALQVPPSVRENAETHANNLAALLSDLEEDGK